MADIMSPETRSRLMSRIRGKDTKPEMAVRRYLHARGFRYRLHVKDLPGKPDIVLPRYRTVIFVHGCFWHQHPGCGHAVMPKSNAAFWAAKLRANTERDIRHRARLEELGWRVITIWECEARMISALDSIGESLTVDSDQGRERHRR